MSLIDKVKAVVSPTEESSKNLEARQKAKAAAGSSGWLAQVLEHHHRVEEAFAACRDATSASGRRAAQKWLALLLTAHSIAEEAVIYPAMANGDQKSHADEMYKEQSDAKVQMAALDDLDPMSADYLDKLEGIRGAVAHHVAEEEGEYFPKLKEEAGSAVNAKLTRHYREAFERYMGSDLKAAA